MDGFSEYISHHGIMPSNAELSALLHKYPWFTTARVLLAELAEANDKPDALLAMHQLSHTKRQVSAALNQAINIVDTKDLLDITIMHPADTDEQCAGNPDENDIADEEIINAFLSKGTYRIVPDENVTEYDAAEQSGVLDITDDFISEELAEIYLAQGLKAQAKEIYAQLSLLNPEKSVYFAAIIGQLNSENK